MTDQSSQPSIVERLRDSHCHASDHCNMDHGLQTDAADEIEHLASDIAVKARLLTAQAKEIASLRAALVTAEARFGEIYDLIDKEDVAEPLDDAISSAKKGMLAIAAALAVNSQHQSTLGEK